MEKNYRLAPQLNVREVGRERVGSIDADGGDLRMDLMNEVKELDKYLDSRGLDPIEIFVILDAALMIHRKSIDSTLALKLPEIQAKLMQKRGEFKEVR